MTSKVVIPRGLQGSGKSTYVKKFCDSLITENKTFSVFSADFYWIDPITQEYKFVMEDIGKAHAKCFRDFAEAVQKSTSEYYFVDNTNIRPQDIAPYVAIANAYGLEYQIVTIMCDPEVGIKRNLHGVGSKTIRDNHKAILRIQLPPYWNHQVIDPDNLMSKKSFSPIEELRSYAEKFKVLDIANKVLNDPRFPDWSGSSRKDQHHYGRGGLAQHVLEVVELCLQTNKYFYDKCKSVDDTQLFLAALFHDCGKMWDYKPLDENFTEWDVFPHKRRIHHVSRSCIEWNNACNHHRKDYDWLTEEIQEDITHAILSHHGLKDWGSPVSPNSRLAWNLHLCDSISARLDDAYTLDRRL